MTVLEKVKNAEKQFKDNTEEVKAEIKQFFKEKFDSPAFENYIEEICSWAIKEGKTQVEILAEFWQYTPGCSNTYFSFGRFRWSNPNTDWQGQRVYKGVDLKVIHQDLINEIVQLGQKKLTEMGFVIHDTQIEYNSFKEMKMRTFFGWC